MKVAVIGATGFVGRHLCDTLVGRGDKVTVLVRNPESAELLERRGVSVVLGDLTDEESLIRVCNGADSVFNLAGALGKWGVSSGEMETVNARSPGLIVHSAARAGAGKVVHTSTAGVSGPLPAGTHASEAYLPHPATDYQRTKLAGENSALEAHGDTGMPLVIVRPAFVYGPGDMHKLSLFRTVASGRMLLVNGGRSEIHPIYVDDLVSGLITAAQRSPGEGEIYIMAGPRPVTTRELVETIAGTLAVPAPRLSLPGGLLMPLARTMEITFGVIRKEPALTRSRVKLFSENYAYSIDKARKELMFKPLVNLAEGASLTAKWYMSHSLLRVKRREERYADR